jgi:hypothetical protein
MTTIMLALLSGFLTTQQVSELSVLCTASKTTTGDGITISCAVLHTDPQGKMDIVQRVESPELKVTKVPVPGLAAVWCAGIEAALDFPQSAPT